MFQELLYSTINKLRENFDLSMQVESKKSVKQTYLDTGRITQEEYDRILSWDPTEQKRYSDWLAKQFIAGIDPVELEYGIKDFHRGVEKNLVRNKDINTYSIEEFNRVLGKIEGVKTRREAEEEIKKEADKVWENDEYLVVAPKTKEASIYYGKGTKWCTSATKSRNYFDEYRYREYVKLYYIISKKSQEKWAVAVDLEGEIVCYNQEDEEISVKAIPNSIPKDIFKPLDAKEFIESITREAIRNSDGSYSFKGDLDLSHIGLKSLSDLGIVIDRVEGDFYCGDNYLTTLRGGPKEVGKSFYCNNNYLTTLRNSPEEVGGSFNCSYNRLITFEGGPRKVGKSFICRHNLLTTLRGSPEEVGESFICSHNRLTSLQGAPEKVNGDFLCYNNKLTSLQGSPREVGGNFCCFDNNLTSLRGAPEKVGIDFICTDNPFTSLEGKPKYIGGEFIH